MMEQMVSVKHNIKSSEIQPRKDNPKMDFYETNSNHSNNIQSKNTNTNNKNSTPNMKSNTV